MDRLEEWRTFVAVAGHKSFTKGARALGKSPQAATRAVAALEARLGLRLLRRTTRSVSLTHEGARSLERGRRLIEELERLEAPEDPLAALTGTLTVTAPVLFGHLHVLPVVTEMLALHQELDVRLLLLDRVVSLAEEGVDVAVRIGALPDSSLLARAVGHVRVVTCASPAYLKRAGAPRTPEDLARHACVAFTGTTPVVDRWPFPAVAPAGRARSVAVRPRLVVNSGEAALDAATAGVGVVRLLSYQVKEALAEKALRLVLEEHEPPPLPVQLVQPPGLGPRAPGVFIDLAAARLRARLALK